MLTTEMFAIRSNYLLASLNLEKLGSLRQWAAIHCCLWLETAPALRRLRDRALLIVPADILDSLCCIAYKETKAV